jgi:hypothetical protein
MGGVLNKYCCFRCHFSLKREINTTAFLSDKMIELLSRTVNTVMERDYKCARNILFAEEHDVNTALTAELVCIKKRENDVT